MNIEITIEELKAEIRAGARAILQVRHAERPKMDPDDPTFGDALHLTREGARTAKLLGEGLAEFSGDVAFASSPLTRTRETAELIAEGMGLKGAPVYTDMQLGNEFMIGTSMDSKRTTGASSSGGSGSGSGGDDDGITE